MIIIKNWVFDCGESGNLYTLSRALFIPFGLIFSCFFLFCLSFIKFARCTRVLRKFDSCPGEKSLTNLSTMQNPSTVSRHCKTREPSWAEDFIDLTEFCQPSTIPIKMEDSVDECTASPITSNNTGWLTLILFRVACGIVR